MPGRLSLVREEKCAARTNQRRKYFEVILPDYDRDKVFHSDMKKVIKWFNFLNERGYLTAEPDKTGEEE